MSKSGRILLTHGIVFGAAAAYYAVMNALGITCPIRAVIGYPCPACGMSRALVSLLFLDFDGYVYYNIMAVPVVLGILAAIHFGRFKETKKFVNVYLIAAVVLNAAYYAVRLITNTAP